MPDFPFETTLLISAGLISLVLSGGTLIFLLANRVRRTIRRVRVRQVKHISIPQNVLRFVATILWLTASLAVLFTAAFVQSFQTFTKEELVAEVKCITLKDAPGSMLMQLTPILQGERLKTLGFVLNGDQWALEGNVLKWDSWLNFAGLHTMYKLTRVRGRHLNIEDERAAASSAYSLAEEENVSGWQWLYKYGYRLRFVDSVYGNTVYTYPSEEDVFQVFVTTSGFIVRVKDEES